jgi:hypothetical protein
VDNIKMNLGDIGMVWAGLVWLRKGDIGGLLLTQKLIFGFHEMLVSF